MWAYPHEIYEGGLILNLSRKFLRNRLSLLVAPLAVLALALAGPKPAAIAVCPDAGWVRYYSDATYTTLVGKCSHGCCELWTCTGQMTDYSTSHLFTCN
jgi:hypothetical protein